MTASRFAAAVEAGVPCMTSLDTARSLACAHRRWRVHSGHGRRVPRGLAAAPVAREGVLVGV
ncbi:MAG: hypothetical protein WKH64_10780 [Chloroflexia bacterium]